MAKLILFDLGDVACRFVPERRTQAFAHITGRSATELEQLFWHSGFSTECDHGAHTLKSMCAYMNDHLQARFSIEVLAELWQHAFEPNENVIAIARALAKTTQVGLLTNNSPLLRHGFENYFPQLYTVFDPILFSYELGVTKPHPEVFRLVQMRYAKRGEDVLLIDDSPDNVSAALSAGWQAITFSNAQDLVSDLRSSGYDLEA